MSKSILAWAKDTSVRREGSEESAEGRMRGGVGRELAGRQRLRRFLPMWPEFA